MPCWRTATQARCSGAARVFPKRKNRRTQHQARRIRTHFAYSEFIARADAAVAGVSGLRIVCFGHIGDGNLHYNQSRSDAQSNADFIAQTAAVNRIVHDLVHQLGGSISAEHGLGQLKREEVLRYKSGTEMDLMRAVKQALDPRGLMNPGKVL